MSAFRSAIRDMSAAGRTAPEIANELGIACNTVRYHLARLGDDEVPEAHSLVLVPPSDVVTHVRTRERVAQLLAEGRSRAEVARALELSKSTVSYHARRLGQPVDTRGARRYDWSAVQAYYDTGATVRECRCAFGFSKQSWHAAVKRGDVVARPAAMPLSVLLAAGAPRGREHLKRRLLAAGLMRMRCDRCALVDWRGEPISLALHHVNGDRHDNRLENLQLLCPNCHSQTENFAGRNRRAAGPVAETARPAAETLR